MIFKNKFVIALILFSLLSTGLIACSGGGDSDNSGNTTTSTDSSSSSGNPTPEITVLPESYDFGTVTGANSAAPLEVTIQNSGTADLVVSDISLSETTNFVLDFTSGDNACASATPTITAGNSCTVTVEFLPQDTQIPTDGISYAATLAIQSNDSTTPTFDVDLTGKRQDITSISVKINQIDACPRDVGSPVTAYVSVTDQAGFPVTTLGVDDFRLIEADVQVDSTATSFVNNSVSLSVALLMDYSYSITQEPDNVTDMQKAAVDFIEQLGDNDEAAIIKYATTIEITQSFTSDKTLLTNAIQSTPEVGLTTAFYDSLDTAIESIAASAKDRQAIIIITDGEDNDGDGNPLSTSTMSEIIDEAIANGVPIFTIGLGDRVDPDLLAQISDDTGGTFSPSATSDNLTTIYGQLADLLFTDQYVLTYETGLGSADSGNLQVTATYTTSITGSDTMLIQACQ